GSRLQAPGSMVGRTARRTVPLRAWRLALGAWRCERSELPLAFRRVSCRPRQVATHERSPNPAPARPLPVERDAGWRDKARNAGVGSESGVLSVDYQGRPSFGVARFDSPLTRDTVTL